MFYRRDILTKIEDELATKEIIVITGMRQVGKTTILNHMLGLINSDNKVLFDLENPLHRKVFEEENYDAVWSNLIKFGITSTEKAYIFLDEIQNLPQISKVVKYLYDHWQVKFFLTGSSSFYLKNLFPESMAGRKIVFEMYPLTFSEFLRFKGKERTVPAVFLEKVENKNQIEFELYNHYYQEFLEFGGFPKVVLEENPDRKKKLLEEIFTSYFEKDVKTLADFRDISKLRDLILLLIPRVGSRLEINKLASELSITRETVYNYLTFLEQTYFILLIPRFSKSIDRQAAGSKKLFFCDGGLANLLGKLSSGQLFEQSIFQNLRPVHKLAYYIKDGRNEIDCIVDNRVALEVKLSSSARDVENLKRRVRALEITEYYIVSLKYSEDKNIILAIDL